jgi:hypothetical protein
MFIPEQTTVSKEIPMRFRALFDFMKLGHGNRGRRTSRWPTAFQLQLEALEDRTLPSFYAPVSYATDTSPYAVVTADFNRDGRLDLAVANYGSNTVSILLGNGDGTFQAARNYTTDAYPRSVAVGDFNGDGKLDLVTATDAGTVSVLLGNGDGSFQPAQNFRTGGNSPVAVAVGDFNADGKMDLAVTGFYPGTPGYWGYYGNYYPGNPPASEVTVLVGNGDGTFAWSSSYDLGGYFVPAVATADFNGDGNADLAWADEQTAAVSVLLGNGDGTFAPAAQSFTTDCGPSSLAVADLNGDGTSDLVTANVNGNSSASVLLGNGDGTFQAAQNYATGDLPTSVAVADFNGDGKPDLVTTDLAADSVAVLPGNGDGSFRSAQLYAAGPGADAVAAGDFNGDGRPDVAVTDNRNDAVGVLLNTGDWRTFQVSGFPSPTTAGDPHTLTVRALDASGNTLPSYIGTVHFTGSDMQAGLPKDYAFMPSDNGTHTFTVTLKTAGTQSVTVTDTGPTAIGGTQLGIAVNPGAVSRFQVTYFPSPVSVGDYGYFAVSPYDDYDNPATNYAGTVHFTSSDGHASLPDDYAFTGSENGTAYFSAALNTAGPQSLTVSDEAHPAATGSQTGIRVNPVATVSGPDGGLTNQALTLTLGASSGLPASTVFTYTIDWNGDNIVDQTVTGPSGTTVSHTYTSAGTYAVGVTASVHLGTEDFTSYVIYHYAHIFAVTATVQADPGDATKSALVVQGTAGADSLVLSPGTGNAIALSVSGYSVGSFAASGGAAFAHLLVYGNGGADTIRLAGNLSVPALLFGGDGNDTLDASGSTANNILVGGAGNEAFFGGSGRSLLIGGAGADTLRAGSGDAILIGGYTSYDGNVPALLALMKEWGRTDANYTTRVKHLNGTLSGGLNGSFRLTKSTVQEDSVTDNLYGGAGMDWFIVSGTGRKKDKVFGQTSGELVSNL